MPLRNQDQEPSRHALDISAEELKALQESDVTLEAVRKAADGSPSTAGVGFFRRGGLLYKRWAPPGRDSEDMAVEQLVLPLQCRKTVLELAHEIPLAGHLGKDKTAHRILQRFYWPTLYKDVADFCHGCGICQKTSQYKNKRAPLMPLPIIDTPFQRIAMDIVGPLPRSRRKTVLELAHEIPLAGHLGKDKTAHRILQRFYWPTLYKDVADFCHGCGICQKTSQYKNKRAPLMPLPIIDTPFQRIAMDIVGPLPRSRQGNRYILVVCDYATRYPEAVALRPIDADHIAEELMKMFARVGIPEEILTDQGTNFTSQLLAELYRMLHVHPIRTSPYHPQTDGLVERFNKTLKSMLRKAAIEEGKDWDKMLPYLLFAYREVPHASTGFSPFELLYGHAVNGPLDVLKECSITCTVHERQDDEDDRFGSAEYEQGPGEAEALV